MRNQYPCCQTRAECDALTVEIFADGPNSGKAVPSGIRGIGKRYKQTLVPKYNARKSTRQAEAFCCHFQEAAAAAGAAAEASKGVSD